MSVCDGMSMSKLSVDMSFSVPEFVDGILNALRGDVIRIVLYGSVARGTQTKDSDIAIALFVPKRLDQETEERS